MSGRVVVVAGATGLVGGALVRALVADGRVARVVCVVRKPLVAPELAQARDAGRLEERVVPSFDDDALRAAMPKDIEDAYCCLGRTLAEAGSRLGVVKVDHDAVVSFARAARQNGCRRFIALSSMAADPRSVSFYLRVKGDMEASVSRIGFDVVHLVRPWIFEGERAKRRPMEELGARLNKKVAALFGGPRFRWAPIHVDVVARAMVALAFSDGKGAVVSESRRLQELGAAS